MATNERITMTAGEDLTENLLGKLESGTNDIVLAGSGERAYGVIKRTVSDGGAVPVEPIHTAKRVSVVASETITKGDRIFPAASGKVQNAPGSGSHYRIGYADEAASADEVFDVIVDPTETASS